MWSIRGDALKNNDPGLPADNEQPHRVHPSQVPGGPPHSRFRGVEPWQVVDYGTNRLGFVQKQFVTGNAPAVSSGLTCISRQTHMERDVLISYSDKRGRMGEERTDLLRGTLDLLILKALALEPLHGVAVSRRITQITAGAFRVSFGSLFPALHRMEEKGWVQAEWRASENNRRAKYYCLTSPGRAQLRAEERDWSQVVKIMTAAIESA
jgi:PadR family transcriptional regulator PadR